MTTGEATRGRDNRRVAVFATAGVGVVLVAVLAVSIGWPVITRHVATGVHMTWVDRPTCSGTSVSDEPSDSYDPAGPTRPAVIRARPGMRCVVTVEIVNNGSHAVRLQELVAPWLGSGSGTEFRADPGGSPRLHTSATDDQDASYVVHGSLAGHARTRLQVSFVFRDQPCQSDGVFSAYHWPELRISALGRSYTVSADHDLFVRYHRGGPTPSSSSPQCSSATVTS